MPTVSSGAQENQTAKWQEIAFRKIEDRRGNLTPIEGNEDIPFHVARVYYLYDIPSGSVRAGHAHISLLQVYIALSGSFKVFLDDGSNRENIILNRPDRGLLIRQGVWREISDFSAGAVCLVLASDRYSERDYIRDYSSFLSYVRN